MAENSEKERINLIGPYLKRTFGEKTVKLSLDGGFTCPNRDGTLGHGGCSFCSERGSGDNASTIQEQIRLLSTKWPNVSSYIAYFQNFTGTYAPVDRLRHLYYGALEQPGVHGLAIATRPDCLSEEILELLSEINDATFLWIELGLQTTNDYIARSFGRCYDTSVYYDAVEKLSSRDIRVVTHLLFGLPGETKDSMRNSLTDVIESGVWGLKFHLLNLVRGTRMAAENPDYMPFSTPEEYVSMICDFLEITPYDMVIHRLSADTPAELLIAPKWAYRKRLIINMILSELKKRDTRQGVSSGTIISGPNLPSL